jgi:hypothetical protein
VVRVTKEDYETVVALGMSSASGQIVPMQASSVEPKSVATVATPATGGLAGAGSSDGGGPIDLGLLFKTVERLKVAGKLGTSLSEYDTRAESLISTWKPWDTRSWATSSVVPLWSRATFRITCCA